MLPLHHQCTPHAISFHSNLSSHLMEHIFSLDSTPPSCVTLRPTTVSVGPGCPRSHPHVTVTDETGTGYGPKATIPGRAGSNPCYPWSDHGTLPFLGTQNSSYLLRRHHQIQMRHPNQLALLYRADTISLEHISLSHGWISRFAYNGCDMVRFFL